MPEIVYNLRIEVDESSKKIVESAIDKGFAKGMKDAAAEIEKTTGKQVTFNKIMEDGNQEIKERSNLLKANTTNVQSANAQARNYDNTLKRLITDEKTDIATLRKKAQQHRNFIPVLEESVNEMRAYGAATEMSEQESIKYNNTLARAEQTLRTMMSTNINLSNSLKQSAGEMGDVTGQAGKFNKTMSGANQTLFGFSDLIQDSSQFMVGGSFNFSTGMRAIGNNIGFTAELFGNLNQNVDRYNQAVADGTIKNGKQVTTFQAIKKSLLGPGGVILAINGVVTAVTILTNVMGKNKKATDSAKDSLGDFVKESAGLRGTGEFDFLNIESIQRQITVAEELKNIVIANQEEIDKQNLRVHQSAREEATPVGAFGMPVLVFSPQTTESEKEVEEFKETISGLADVTEAELTKAIDDLNTRLKINQALFDADPLAQFISAESRATQEALLLVDAGLKTNEFLEQRRDKLRELIKAETDGGLATNESKARYLELNKQLDSVNGALKELNTNVEVESREADIKVAQKELDIIDASNELKKTQLQAELDRFKIREDLAARKKEIDELELDDEQKKTLRLQEESLARLELAKITAEENIAIKEIEEEKKLDIEKKNAEISKSIEKQKLETVKKVQSGILNLSKFFAKENKGIALALLGVEKSIAISQVIIDAKQKIFEATAAGASATASFNFLGASIAFSQVGLIKAKAAATIASIAAQGLKQGGSITGGSGGGGGGGGGVASASKAQRQRGFFETSFTANNQQFNPDRISPSFDPSRPQSIGATIVLEGSLDEEVMAYKVKSGNAKIESGTTYLGD
jgi:hypothetical protein